MSKRCPTCNIWNADDAKFCRNCGKQFEMSSASKTTSTSKSTTTSTSTSTSSSSDAGDIFLKVLGTIFVIGVCIAIAVGTSGYGTPIAFGGVYALKAIWD